MAIVLNGLLKLSQIYYYSHLPMPLKQAIIHHYIDNDTFLLQKNNSVKEHLK